MLSVKEIIYSREKTPPDLPTFGMKEFEPNGSSEQAEEIKRSISTIKNIISHERVKLLNALSQAVWQPQLHLAEVTHQTGSYWSYMGHKIDDKLYIHPEEALYLLETGSIQINYNGVALSIQRAYAVLLGVENSVSLEKYRVYSLLNKYGYKVLRHSPKNSVTKYEKKLEIHKLGIKLKNYDKVVPGVRKYQDSSQMFSKGSKRIKLETNTHQFIQIEDVSAEDLKQTHEKQWSHYTEVNLDFDYDIYSESYDKLPFKKSYLQLPNFRVVIHRGEDSFPDLGELCRLSCKYKDEVPVIHAIVFFDSIAFYKINPVILPNVHE